MTREEVINKIKKLLELSNSPNMNEAELALKKAQKLMDEYSIQQLHLNESEKQIIKEEYKPPFSMPGMQPVLPYIVNSIVEMFGCTTLILVHNGVSLIYGYPTNLEIAKHAVDCILRQGKVDCEIGFRKNRSIAFVPSFWSGFAYAIQEKFKPQKTNSEIGIVLYNKVKEQANKESSGFYHDEKTITNSFQGTAMGQNSGKNASIRQGVGQSTSKGNYLS